MLWVKVDIKGRTLLKEALNMDTAKGLVRLIHKIFIVTLIFEGAGAIAGFLVFIRDYPFFRALGISVFHSVAALIILVLIFLEITRTLLITVVI